MAEKKQRSTSENIRLWVQAIGIPLALAGLGLWQFWLDKVVWPAQAPVNLTMELHVKEAGSNATGSNEDSEEQELEAIEFSITARNPSKRSIYLLRNYWQASGLRVKSAAPSPTEQEPSIVLHSAALEPPAPIRKTESWLKAQIKQLNETGLISGGKHYDNVLVVPIALGAAFPDNVLHPGEQVTRTFTIYTPIDSYDGLEVFVNLPTTPTSVVSADGAKLAAIEVEYSYDPTQLGGIVETYWTIDAYGNRDVNELFNTLAVKYGLQKATSSVNMSLWQSRPTVTDARDGKRRDIGSLPQ